MLWKQKKGGFQFRVRNSCVKNKEAEYFNAIVGGEGY